MVNQAKESQATEKGTQKVIDTFESLGTDDKLAVFYYAYKKMGDSITPAAPTSAEPELAPRLLGDYLTLSEDEQLQIMRDIVEGKDTEWSRAYGALTATNQLMVWYSWAVEMGTNVVDMPADYEMTKEGKDVLNHLEKLEFEGQMSVFRQFVSDMGYSDVKAVPTQAETGITPSL